jgi:ATPase subunit of ABC transporter with duplicated ATPase domains
MNLLKITNLAYSVGEKTLFSGINLNIHSGNVIGLIGENGSGKSSLLKLIAGYTSSNAGSILPFQKNLTINYLGQLDTEDIKNNLSVYEYLISLNEEYWKIIALAEEIFGLVINNFETKINTLSGGEIMQLNLANVFLENPDIILLDEPTNHLDIVALTKLKNYIASLNSAFIIVSHNKNFIENVCKTIWKIEDGKIEYFNGKLSKFEEYQNTQQENKEELYRVEKFNLKKLEEASKREKEKAEKGENSIRKKFLEGSYDSSQYGYFKNIGSKSSGKTNSKFEHLKEESKAKISKFKSFDQPILLPNLVSKIQQGKRKLLTIEKSDLNLGGKIILKNINLELIYGQRVAIIGKNGSGKTSLVSSIYQDNTLNKNINEKYNPVERLEQVFLSNFKLAENIEIAYLSQRYDIVDKSKTVLENVLNYAQNLTEIEARHHLSNFKFFTTQEVAKLAKSLSGGELARLALAMVTCKNIDLLILDEPTNNLDILVINQITSALANFPGSILVISHDINFLEDLKIEQVLLLKNGIAINTVVDKVENLLKDS